ncbi:[FeFe] hydrogenase, group A [Desulfosediminicola sp.]|uniref:[FeFe] hydrogenase, group A n=1 Tax=Desulfosediminicola sp. TaxID=2886825 RepID=UPI003AF257A9
MTESIVSIDSELCTGCGRCKDICPVGAISGEPAEPHRIAASSCIVCGQCVQVCSGFDSSLEEYPTGRQQRLRQRGMLDSVSEPLFAAHYRGDIHALLAALEDGSTSTFVQCAPAVRVALGEEFGMGYGALTPGKLAAALRALGFDRVYDTTFAADLTIMEEGAELIERIQGKGRLPMFTSCCPGWVKFIEDQHPDLLENMSSCKSPQQMAGTLFKTYGAGVDKVDPASIFSVAVMPCTAKKFECARPEMDASGHRDVDLVITTRELAQLIKHKGLDFLGLDDEPFDNPLGCYSGAGNIFGTTGGVMEAALRSACEVLTGVPLGEIELEYVRGGEGLRYADIVHQDLELRVAIVAGLANVRRLLDEVRRGEADVHFVEVMCCPMGCVSGGGQPKPLLPAQHLEAHAGRKSGLYCHDKKLAVRKSHDNPQVKKLYADFLGEPLGHESHRLLHTDHTSRRRA